MKTSIKNTMQLLCVAALSLTFSVASASSSMLSQSETKERCDTNECKAQMQKLKDFANNGSPEALAIVAVAYATGDGLEQDERKARVMMKEAIRLRSALGMYVKSRWLEQGFIFEQDSDRALYFLNRSADLGYEVANYEMAARLLIEEAPENPEKVSKGFEYLQRSADEGYIPALYTQARMLEEVATTSEELVSAARLYVEVAQRNHRDAKERLHDLITVLENTEDTDEQALAELRELRDIEVIRVAGRDIDSNLSFAMNRVTASLQELGFYDGVRTGSRMSRQRPCSMDPACQMPYWKGDTAGTFAGTVAEMFGE